MSGLGLTPRNTFAVTIHPHKDGFAPEPVRECPREVVHRGFGEAEGGDVGERPCVQVQIECLGSEQEQPAALLSEGAAHQRADRHKKQELRQVLPKPSIAPFGPRPWRGCVLPCMRSAPFLGGMKVPGRAGGAPGLPGPEGGQARAVSGVG